MVRSNSPKARQPEQLIAPITHLTLQPWLSESVYTFPRTSSNILLPDPAMAPPKT